METGIRPPTRLQPGGPSAAHAPPNPPPSPPSRPVLAPRSGWVAFDALQLVKPGRLLLVDAGCDAASRLLMGLLAGAVAQGRDAVVVDGGNWLDVYRLGDAARAHGLRREAVLDGVRVARGFTAHQLQSLVEDALPRALEEGASGVGLALVASLPEMYLDEDLSPSEARILLTRALRVLRDEARRHRVPVVASNTTLAPRHRHRLRAALDAGVDDAVAILPAPHGAMRLHARDMPAALLAPDPRTRQRRLGEFAPRGDASGGAFYRRAIDARIKYAPKRAGEFRARQRQQSDAPRALVAGGA